MLRESGTGSHLSVSFKHVDSTFVPVECTAKRWTEFLHALKVHIISNKLEHCYCSGRGTVLLGQVLKIILYKILTLAIFLY